VLRQQIRQPPAQGVHIQGCLIERIGNAKAPAQVDLFEHQAVLFVQQLRQLQHGTVNGQ
jgi:hypothetical protein